MTLWNTPRVKGHFPCGMCTVCRFTSHTSHIDLGLPRLWEQRDHSNCNTENCIYMIICPCGQKYIGMTTRKVKIRIGEHRSTIRRGINATRLTAHYLEHQHKDNDLQWTVIERMKGGLNLSRRLLMKEQKWIYSLKTYENGLNDSIPWGLLGRS